MAKRRLGVVVVECTSDKESDTTKNPNEDRKTRLWGRAVWVSPTHLEEW